MNLIRYRLLSYFIIMLLVILSYWPSFSGGFLLDDNYLIKDNPFIKDPHSLISYINQEDGIVSGKNQENGHTGYYRPFVNLTYRMDYLLWGMNPRGFRATNIVLHLLTCYMLFNLILLIIKEWPVAFWATCLFALHPVNTETVSWVSSRNNILVTLFSLICLQFFVKCREDQKPLKLVASVLFFALAVFSKEFGLIVLPCLFFYQRFLSADKRKIFHELAGYLPFLLVVAGYFYLRKTITGSWITPSESIDLLERIYFVPYLLMWNLRLILFPHGLHSFIVSYPDHYLFWQVWLSIVCMGVIGFLTYRTKKNNLAQFAIISFFISLFPVLNVFITSAVTLVSMRWLYFPMIFAALLLARFVSKPLRSNFSLSIAILVSISMYMGTYSYILNKYLWHDEHAFFSQEVQHFDNSFYYGELAENLFNRKELADAEKYFKIAIATFPKTPRNYINYAALLIECNRPEEAITLLNNIKSLLMTRKERAEWLNNLGSAHFNLKEIAVAINYLKKAVSIKPGESYLWVNLGAGYSVAGDYKKALSAFKKGLETVPDSISIKKEIAIVYFRMNEFSKAISVLKSIPVAKWPEHGIRQLYVSAIDGKKAQEKK